MLNKISAYANRSPLLKPVKWKIAHWYYQKRYRNIRRSDDKVVINIYGIQRSGNHAIINWITKSWTGPVMLCNDIKPNQSPDEAPIKKFQKGEGTPLLILTQEEYLSTQFNLIPPADIGNCSRFHNLLILRDPFNLLASRYVWKFNQGQRFREEENYRNQVVALWKDNARIYLDWLGQKSPNNLGITYNDWCSDAAKRHGWEKVLGLKPGSTQSTEVLDFGGGSSFSGTNPVKDQGQYLRRFEGLVDDAAFRSVFKDDELWQLSEQIFGIIPGTEALRQ